MITMDSIVIKSTVVDDTTIEIRHSDIIDDLYELWIGDTCAYSSMQYSSVLHEYNMEVL